MTNDLFGVHIQSGSSIVPRETNGDLKVEARALRDEGMKRAADHADAVELSWTDRAFGYVKEYFARNAEGTCEDVRHFAAERGFANPPDGRAWGAVMRTAAKSGMLVKGGWTTATDPKVHCNPVMLWQRVTLTSAEARAQLSLPPLLVTPGQVDLRTWPK